jgi:hypothetical protein
MSIAHCTNGVLLKIARATGYSIVLFKDYLMMLSVALNA